MAAPVSAAAKLFTSVEIVIVSSLDCAGVCEAYGCGRPKLNMSIKSPSAGRFPGTYAVGPAVGFGRLSRLRGVIALRPQCGRESRIHRARRARRAQRRDPG